MMLDLKRVRSRDIVHRRLPIVVVLSALLQLGLVLEVQAVAPVPSCFQDEGYFDGSDFHMERDVAPGVVHRFDSFSTGPISFNTVSVDLGRKDLVIEAEKALDLMTQGEALDAMVKRLEDPAARPIVAVNADFWGDRRIPIGLFVDEGIIWKDPYLARSIFAFDDAGNFAIGPAQWSVCLRGSRPGQVLPIDRVNFPEFTTQTVVYTWPVLDAGPEIAKGQTLAILKLERPEWLPNAPAAATVDSIVTTGTASLDRSTVVVAIAGKPPAWVKPGAAVALEATLGNLPGKVIGVVGGGPMLVEKGEIVPVEAGERERMGRNFVTDLHPRTAVGLLPYGKTAVFCVVDGRQPGRSIGINLIDLAHWMKDRGCVEAMNLDGGGSSTMVVRGEIVNFPSDSSGPRPVSNALVIRRTAPIGPLHHLEVRPRNAIVPPRARIQLHAYGFDEANEPVSLSEWNLQWSAVGQDFDLRPDGTLHIGEDAPQDGSVLVSAFRPDMERVSPRGDAALRVRQPARVEANPSALLLGSGEKTDIRFQAYTDDGKAFLQDASLWEVRVPPFLRYVPSERKLSAASAGKGSVTATLASRTVKVPVAVDHFKQTLVYSFDTLTTPDVTGWIEGARYKKEETKIEVVDNREEGQGAWEFTYAMSHGGTTRIALPINVTLPGKPLAVGLWVYGDGNAQWLRGELRDANNRGFYLDFTNATEGIAWKDEWRFVRASLVHPPAMGGHVTPPMPPLTVKSIYIAQAQEAAKRDGAILIDGLYALDLPDDLSATGAP